MVATSRTIVPGALALALPVAFLAMPGPATALAVGPSSTAVMLSTAQSVYGQTVTVSAAVAAVPGPPQGDVVFTLDGTTIKANLRAGGTAAVVLPKAGTGEHRIAATFVPQFPTDQEGSTSPTLVWVVGRASTNLGVQVTGKGARIPTSVRVRVDGAYGTLPSGSVRVVVKQLGTQRRKRLVRPLSGEGGVVVGLGKLREGDYRAQVIYAGDAQHLEEKRVERFRVRRR